jgi:hypothetical protein
MIHADVHTLSADGDYDDSQCTKAPAFRADFSDGKGHMAAIRVMPLENGGFQVNIWRDTPDINFVVVEKDYF